MKERKKRNQNPDIDPLKVEAMVALGYSMIEIAQTLNIDRKTLHNYRRSNPALEAAVQRGLQRLRPRKQNSLRPVSEANTAELLEHLMYDVLGDVHELRNMIAADPATRTQYIPERFLRTATEIGKMGEAAHADTVRTIMEVLKGSNGVNHVS